MPTEPSRDYTFSSISYGLRYSRLKNFIASGLSRICSVFTVDAQFLATQPVADRRIVGHEHAAMSFLNVGIWQLARPHTLAEVLLVLRIGEQTFHLVLQHSLLQLGANEDLPSTAVSPKVHQTFTAVDFDTRGALRPIGILVGSLTNQG